jgi:ubiquinone/menaquinone biosynthesis C-methylase UbiE
MDEPQGLLAWARAWEEAFERCARAYSENVGPIFAALGEGALEHAALRSGERVLDIASGPGLITAAAAMRVGAQGLAVGIDTSPTMGWLAVRNAARAGGGGVPRFLAASARGLPVRTAKLDAVLSSFGLPLSGSPAEFSEALRVLKPGGRLSLVTFGPAFVDPFFDVSRMLRGHRTQAPSAFLSMYRELSERMEREFHRQRAPDHLRSLAEGAGFTHVEVDTSRVRQRMWGIMNFVDFALSFPLNYLEYAEMGEQARAAFHANCQVELKKHMDLEEFIATAELVHLTGRKLGG